MDETKGETMNFTHTWPLLIGGRKTQTRRLRHPGERLVTLADGRRRVLSADGRLRWETGRSYAIQAGRGRRQIGRFDLVDVWPDLASAISEADARAEGFAGREAFLAVWQQLYGAGAQDECWALKMHCPAPRPVDRIVRCADCRAEIALAASDPLPSCTCSDHAMPIVEIVPLPTPSPDVQAAHEAAQPV